MEWIFDEEAGSYYQRWYTYTDIIEKGIIGVDPEYLESLRQKEQNAN